MAVSMGHLILGMVVVLLYVFRRKLFKNGEHLTLDQIERKLVGGLVALLLVVATIACLYELMAEF